MATSLSRRAGAEFIGTFWLVLGGCGSAVLAAGFPHLGIGFAGVALAFGLTLLTMAYATHLISIPVTNTSVKPARSTGPALFVGGWAVEQLWLFWVAPIVGAILGGSLYRTLMAESPQAQAARPPRPI
jgi:aquaporin Z